MNIFIGFDFLLGGEGGGGGGGGVLSRKID